MKKLSIGISSFSEIIDENYVYVDKTELIHQLTEQGKYYFLSRPRRFGKSLLVDTLKELFEGNEHLFHDQHIHSLWNWTEKFPVVRITFAQGNIADPEDLGTRIRVQLGYIAEKYAFSLPKISIREQFEWLLRNLTQQHNKPVVVLVDEYDKPILDRLSQPEIAAAMREMLKDFYGVLKDNDAYLRFVLLTGVSKFSQVSLFSGLNNLWDITINRDYATLCGYTQTELEKYFADHLDGVDKEKMRLWYNGYNWLGETVYNPFDVMLFLQDKLYRSYWFSTATPTFLMKLLKDGRYYLPEMERFEALETSLGSFDVSDISAEVLLFQTGYLTISKILHMGNQLGFELTYPNLEVKLSFNTHLLDYLTPPSSRASRVSLQIWRLLIAAKLDDLCELFKRFFSSIPHDWYRNNNIDQYEGYYASLFYSQMTACGATTIPEDTTSFGRIDLTAISENKVFVFEFKVVDSDDGNGSALRQIKQRGYAEKYRDSQNLYLIGIEFSKRKRNIVRFDWEKFE